MNAFSTQALHQIVSAPPESSDAVGLIVSFLHGAEAEF